MLKELEPNKTIPNLMKNLNSSYSPKKQAIISLNKIIAKLVATRLKKKTFCRIPYASSKGVLPQALDLYRIIMLLESNHFLEIIMSH